MKTLSGLIPEGFQHKKQIFSAGPDLGRLLPLYKIILPAPLPPPQPEYFLFILNRVHYTVSLHFIVEAYKACVIAENWVCKLKNYHFFS